MPKELAARRSGDGSDSDTSNEEHHAKTSDHVRGQYELGREEGKKKNLERSRGQLEERIKKTFETKRKEYEELFERRGQILYDVNITLAAINKLSGKSSKTLENVEITSDASEKTDIYSAIADSNTMDYERERANFNKDAEEFNKGIDRLRNEVGQFNEAAHQHNRELRNKGYEVKKLPEPSSVPKLNSSFEKLSKDFLNMLDKASKSSESEKAALEALPYATDEQYWTQKLGGRKV